MPREIGPCNTHDKTQIGGETIAGSQYSRTQSIATGATVTALEAGECRTSDTTTCYLYRAKKAFVRTLILRHPSGTSFRLCIIVVTGAAFHSRDHRQYRVYAEALRQPDDHTYAPPWGKRGYSFACFAQIISPDACMTLLSFCHSLVKFCQVWITFSFSQLLI